MSWFEYGTPERRSWRKGVWLRVRNLPAPLVKEAKKYLGITEFIEWVEVKEIRPHGKVYLEFWCRKVGSMKPNKPVINKVFGLVVDENPEWICEGDLGRGYRGPSKVRASP